MLPYQFEKVNGVYKDVNESIDQTFEQLYLAVRNKEGRLYSDEELKKLPHIKKDHPLYNEWQMRKESASRLFKWLQNKKKGLQILEIGCGNGWLTNLLSTINDSMVYGMDINFAELQQAASVFNKSNISFIYGDFHDKNYDDMKFDIIVFAASAQYFSSLKNMIALSLKRLKADGEIHILDTNFYHDHEIGAAKKRTENYYTSLGCSELAGYYHHHPISGLDGFNFKKMYDPVSLKNKLSLNKSPFPWICIKSN